jgi:hypothetical protein
MRSDKVGGLAQLVERLHGMQKVTGSNPVTSTNFKRETLLENDLRFQAASLF